MIVNGRLALLEINRKLLRESEHGGNDGLSQALCSVSNVSLHIGRG